MENITQEQLEDLFTRVTKLHKEKTGSEPDLIHLGWGDHPSIEARDFGYEHDYDDTTYTLDEIYGDIEEEIRKYREEEEKKRLKQIEERKKEEEAYKLRVIQQEKAQLALLKRKYE